MYYMSHMEIHPNRILVNFLRLTHDPSTWLAWPVLLELYNHTNHQVAALNIWETSWPAYIDVLPYISLPLLPHLSHLAADTTLYGSLSRTSG